MTISEKNDEKLLSFSHRAKDGICKVNCFFIDFLRYSFRRIKVISTVVEREYGVYTKITWQICFAYQLTGFYMVKGFTEQYFLTDYSHILENQFYFINAPDYCCKPSLSRIFCVSSSVKVLSPQYEGPSTHISYIIAFHVHYLQKERNYLRNLRSQNFSPDIFLGQR